MFELLAGLPDVNVLAVVDQVDRPIRVVVEFRLETGWCSECGWAARWATIQVGRLGRSVNEVAAESGGD